MYHQSRRANDTSVVTRWVTEARRTGETDSYAGKRSHPRSLWSVPLKVKMVSGRYAGEIVCANTRDVSLGGMGFFSRRRFEIHTEVEVWVHRHPQGVRGKIMHVTQTIGGYVVGIAFDESSGQHRRRVAG